jgi:hypothetical protein
MMRLPLFGPLIWCAAFLVAVGASPASAQSEGQVGQAILEVCGDVDARTEGVLAGTVRDVATGVVLDGAAVVINWQVPGNEFPGTAAERTDADGFFVFCHAPGGVAVDLYAEILDRVSDPLTVGVESGTLIVEHLTVAVSDPTEPGFITGRVIDRTTRLGVPNAELTIRGQDIATLTNERGMFTLDEVPYGVYVIDVQHLAYADRELPLHVAGGLTQNLAIEVSEQAMELEGLTVSVEPRRFYNDMEGLVRRMNLGFGEFMMRSDIEARGATTLPDVLVGVAGVRMVDGGRSLVIRGSQCVPMVFMDGRLFKLDPDRGLLDVNLFDVEAVEFYKGTASIPAEFNYSNNLSVGCGAIVVWTRRGR